MMAEAKVKKWGNSLGLIIPKEIVRIEDLRKDDVIKIDISKERRVDGFGLLKGLPTFKEEDITDF